MCCVVDRIITSMNIHEESSGRVRGGRSSTMHGIVTRLCMSNRATVIGDCNLRRIERQADRAHRRRHRTPVGRL